MGVPDESILDTVYRARAVEGFVKLIVTGGLTLLVGLWATAFAAFPSPGWFLGVGLVILGIIPLGRGIWSQVEY